MMKKNLRKILTMAAVCIGLQASAEESLVEYVVNACEADLETYCSQVTPGQGRILHCIAAHEDKISGQCGYALYQAASLLDQLTEAIYYVATECEADIEKHCSDVAAGEGRVLMCLEDSADELSESCTQAISDVTAE